MSTPLSRTMTSTLIPFTDHLLTEPEEVYAAKRRDWLSSHSLTDFRRNPRLYRHKQLGLVVEPDRASFAIGRAAHCRVLEGRAAFEERYAIGGPLNPKTGRPFGPDTKAFAEWAAQQGRPVVSEETAALCEQLTGAVQAHEEALALLAQGRAEGVVRCETSGVPCQGRLDWVHPERGIVDLKTIDDLDYFTLQARSFAYAHQLAFYRALLTAVSGHVAEVHVIVVEKKEPFRVGVWRFSEQVLDAAGRENLAAIERLKVCRSEDRWPTGYEAVRSFDYLA
ncbi:MAG: PD-(D/E)XK nuclease-like domain-containing protein [Planctomycetes bacterium]|nr:PD-(D/E)XK nuclease-like domain-containing protein [Planctomycetota bacterium]